ncbi:MAG TPA: hypothetical protein VML55_13595 [Planctomycetaceae bacterium]|nr:hypothetical protein [Planctomycetaceae bacterium]
MPLRLISARLRRERRHGQAASADRGAPAAGGHTLSLRGGPAARLARLPALRSRVPARYRPALAFETCYNVGTGAFISLFLLSAVVLKTILGGTQVDLAILAALFGGSSLFSPIVSYCGRTVPMKTMVTWPTVLAAGLLVATAAPFGGPRLFAVVVGLAFVVRVFPRVAEMNMYRVVYPVTHRGSAVGWLKAVAAVSAFAVTLMGYWWFSVQPRLYWLVYWFVAALLVAGVIAYARIPVSRRNIFERRDRTSPSRAFLEGWRIFVSDRRFLMYQIGFSLAGFANHMAMIYVAEILTENVLARRAADAASATGGAAGGGWSAGLSATVVVGFVFAVLPVLLMMVSAPFWGRFLDRVSPMAGRSVFNSLQAVAFALHAWGAVSVQVWPFLVGSALHAIGNGGGTINWLTGSLYFATPERISLYNAIHVALTGLRGLVAPLVGWYLIAETIDLPVFGTRPGAHLGGGLFWLAAALSAAGAIAMAAQAATDPGPRERRGSSA